jgi:hypothetical protein
MAETVRQELVKANSDKSRRRYNFSKDGPVVLFVIKAIGLITGEKPTAGAVAKELERQKRQAKREAERQLKRDSLKILSRN